MSQQPFQTWQSQPWNYQQQEQQQQQQEQQQQQQEQQQQQQQQHTLLNPPMQQEYIDVSNQYLLQAGQLPQQYQSSLNLSQLPTDVFTFDGLPTYSILQLTNEQQTPAYIDDSNLAV